MTVKVNNSPIVSPKRPDILLMIGVDLATNGVTFKSTAPIPLAHVSAILSGLLADFNFKLHEATMKQEIKVIPASITADEVVDTVATIIDAVSSMLDHLDDKLVQKGGMPLQEGAASGT